MEREFLLYSNIFLWLIQLFVLFSLFLIYRQFGSVYLSKGEAISRDGVSIGNEIPAFEGISYSSGKLIKSEMLYEKPTLLTFISASCKPCQELLKY